MNWGNVTSQAGEGFAFGFIPGLDMLPGLNTRGALMPVVKGLFNKTDSGIIKNLSPLSLFKMDSASFLQQSPNAVFQSMYDARGQQPIPLSGGYVPTPAIKTSSKSAIKQ